MDTKFPERSKSVDAALMNLEVVYDHLEYTNQQLQSPNLKRQISNIKRLIQSLSDQVEEMESKHQRTLQENARKKMLVEDERFRTNYNHNSDGRIKGVYYSGPGDMGRKR